MAQRTQKMVLVPRAQADRQAKTRSSRGHVLKEWYMTGIPTVDLYQNADGVLVAATFHLPMDVPAKPRVTRNSTWKESYQNYLNWRRVFRSGVLTALGARGIDLDPDLTIKRLFSDAVALDRPYNKKSKEKSPPPLLTSGLIHCKLRGDWDNKVKSVLDGSNSLIYEDDRLCCGGNWAHVPSVDRDPGIEYSVQYIAQEGRAAWLEAYYASSLTYATRGLMPFLGPE